MFRLFHQSHPACADAGQPVVAAPAGQATYHPPTHPATTYDAFLNADGSGPNASAAPKQLLTASSAAPLNVPNGGALPAMAVRRSSRSRSDSPARHFMTSAEKIAALRSAQPSVALSPQPRGHLDADTIATKPLVGPAGVRTISTTFLRTLASRSTSRRSEPSLEHTTAFVRRSEASADRGVSRAPAMRDGGTSLELPTARPSDSTRTASVNLPDDRLTAVVKGLRLRAKLAAPFARTLRGQISEVVGMMPEAASGDLPFSVKSLEAQCAVWATQLCDYLDNPQGFVPINWRALRSAMHTATKPPRPGSSDVGAPGVGATSHDESEHPPPSTQVVKPAVRMLKRGAGLKRYYGNKPRPEADPEPVAPHEPELTHEERIKALAAPRHVRPAHASALPSQGKPASRSGSAAPRQPVAESRVAPRHSESSRRSASAPSRNAAAAPVAPAEPTLAKRVHATEMPRVLAPEVIDLLSPHPPSDASLAHSLQRPNALSRPVVGLLPSHAMARSLLAPHVQSATQFNVVVDRLTGLLT